MPRSSFRLLLAAISFACRAHRGQRRNDGSTPYVAHPMRVLLTVREELGVEDPEVLAAAVLHDTIEDTTTDRDDLIAHFGERVASLVAALSKDKRLPEPERESAYLEQLAGAPVEARLIKLADTIDNLRDGRETAPPLSAQRRIRKAREVLAALEPGFPPEARYALDAVRAEIAATERGEG